MGIIELRNREGVTVGRVLVDDEDLDRASRWTWNFSDGYAIRTDRSTGRKRTLRLHRWLLGLEPGDPRQVDHENGETLDCRRKNLRITDRHGNAQNRKVNRTSGSGIRGVHRSKDPRRHRRPWIAHLRIEGRQRKLGYFATADEAATAVAEARRRHMPMSVVGR